MNTTDNKLTLKVKLSGFHGAEVPHTLIRSIQVAGDIPTNEVCKYIATKLQDVQRVHQVSCYALIRILAETQSDDCDWLDGSQSLRQQNVNDWELVEMRMRFLKLRLKLPDKRFIEVPVDLADKGRLLVNQACFDCGIKSQDEYALWMEKSQKNEQSFDGEQSPDGSKSDTLKRRKSLTKGDKSWLDPTKPMSFYNLDESSELCLSRRFFFSSDYMDGPDAEELSLMYCQCRDHVLSGRQSLIISDAIELAGYQCQVEYGDHTDKTNIVLSNVLPHELVKMKSIEKRIAQYHSRLKTVSDLEAKFRYMKKLQSLSMYGYTFFLVKEKVKGKRKLIARILGINKDTVVRIDKKTQQIIQSWPLTHVKRWGSSSTSFTLDLGDYGDAYYTVQTEHGAAVGEMISGYINLTLKKRDSTNKSVNINGENGGLGTAVEEVLPAAKAIIIHESTMRTRQFTEGCIMQKRGGVDVVDGLMDHSEQESCPETQSNIMKVSLALVKEMTEEALSILDCRSSTPKQYDELNLAIKRRYSLSRLSAITCETARIALGQLDDPRSHAHGSSYERSVAVSVFTIAINIRDLTSDLQNGLIVKEDLTTSVSSNLSLLPRYSHHSKYIQQLCTSLDELISRVLPRNTDSMQHLFLVAGDMGHTCQALTDAIRQSIHEGTTGERLVVSQAKTVATNVASLVMKARETASRLEQTRTLIIPAATQCALAASMLVCISKAYAANEYGFLCASMFIRSAELLAKCCEITVTSCVQDCHGSMDLYETFRAVMQSINTMKGLVGSCEVPARRSLQAIKYSDGQLPLSAVMSAIDGICNTVDSRVIMASVRTVIDAASELVHLLNQQLDKCSPNGYRYRGLQNDAHTLSDLGSRLDSLTVQATDEADLFMLCDGVRVAAIRATNWLMHEPMFHSLDNCVNDSLNVCIQFIVANQLLPGRDGISADPNRQQSICKNMNSLIELLPIVIDATRLIKEDDCLRSRVHLISLMDDFHIRCTYLICEIGDRKDEARLNSLPTSSEGEIDSLVARKITYCAEDLRLVLDELRVRLDQLTDVYGIGLPNDLLRTTRALSRDLDLDEFYNLPRRHEQSFDEKVDVFVSAFRQVKSSAFRLCLSIVNPNDPFVRTHQLSTVPEPSLERIREICSSVTVQLIDLVKSVRRLTAHDMKNGSSMFMDSGCKSYMVNQIKRVLESSFLLLCEAGSLVSTHERAGTLLGRFQSSLVGDTTNEQLCQSTNQISMAFEDCVSLLPGCMDLMESMKRLNLSANRILAQRVPSFSEQQLDKLIEDNAMSCWLMLARINEAAEVLARRAFNVISGVDGSISQLSSLHNDFVNAFERLLTIGMTFLPYVKSQISARKFLLHLRKIHTSAMSLSDILCQSITRCVNENGKADEKYISDQNTSYRQLSNRVNDMVTNCLILSPGRRINDYALSRLEHAREQSYKIVSPINDMSLVEAHDCLIQYSKELGESVSRIVSSAARQSFTENLNQCAQTAATAAMGLVDSSMQSAFLIADTISTLERSKSVRMPKAQPSVIDQIVFVMCQDALMAAHKELCGIDSDARRREEKVFVSLSSLVEFSVMLCNASREAAYRTHNQSSGGGSHFLDCADEISFDVIELLNEVSAMNSMTDISQSVMAADNLIHLTQSVDKLCDYACSKKFSVIPAPITYQGKEAQRPIVMAICEVIDGTVGLINCLTSLRDAAASSLSSLATSRRSPNEDKRIWQQLSGHTKVISDGIKSLVMSIRDCVPGKRVCEHALEQLARLSHILQASSKSSQLDGNRHSPRPRDRAQIVEKMVFDTLCLDDLMNQIVKTFASSETSVSFGSQVSQYVAATESLLHNVLSMMRIETKQVTQRLLEQAEQATKLSSKMIRALRDGSGSSDRSTASRIEQLKEKCHTAHEELISIVLQDDDTTVNGHEKQRASSESNDDTCVKNPKQLGTIYLDNYTRNGTKVLPLIRDRLEISSSGDEVVCSRNSRTDQKELRPSQPTTNIRQRITMDAPKLAANSLHQEMMMTTRSLVENTKSLVTAPTICGDSSSTPVIGAIEQLTELLHLNDETADSSKLDGPKQTDLLSAVRDVSDSLTQFIEEVKTKPELSHADLKTLKQQENTIDLEDNDGTSSAV